MHCSCLIARAVHKFIDTLYTEKGKQMKKKIAALLTVALLMSGCSTAVNEPNYESENDLSDSPTQSGSSSDSIISDTSSQADDSSLPSGFPTLKWGVNNLGGGFSQSLVSDFNKALHKYGCSFNVEFVDLYREQYFDHSTGAFDIKQAITNYEENKGRLDIIDMAFSEGGIGIEGGQPEEGKKYDFISQGLLEPLDITKIMPENSFPDEIWDMEIVNGAVYTLLSHTMLYPKSLTFYLNTDYIPQDKINSYDGSFEGLVDILSLLPEYGRSVCVLDMSQTYYETACVSSEFDFVQSLVLDYETKKAVNPFEHQQFTDFARTINKAYNSKLITSNRGSNMSFSTYGGCFEYIEGSDGAVIAIISEEEISDDSIKLIFNANPEKLKKFSSSKTYVKNKSSGYIGISAFSEHKEQSVQLLNAVCSDPDCAVALQNIGIHRPLGIMDAGAFENNVTSCGLSLSPVAGYKISYTDVREYSDIKAALYRYYDELCCSENFDAKLEEIKAGLKEMGIDEFVGKANDSLIKNGHMPKQ